MASRKQTAATTEAALRERIKELACLYGIAQLAATPRLTLDELLQGIVERLPPGWQYPEITSARICLDGRTYETPRFSATAWTQTAKIALGDTELGSVEVCYAEKKPELDEGPFLKEERHLIEGVARQVAVILERRRVEEELAKLQDQFRHADRLATLGMLAAGVAHELNEPLNNILGFAQLAMKCEGLPSSARADIVKIETASLHAREVTRKLLVFARQAPPQTTRIDLHKVVDEALVFLEARCAKAGVEVVRVLQPDLPELTADPGQLQQVVVNLVVNALHAMPAGGTLKVGTALSGQEVLLIVEDTGAGMTDGVREQIFMPFFTTKDVGEGTGLGLPVVHGIVTAHGGKISVESQVGRGSRFEVRLPLSGVVGEGK